MTTPMFVWLGSGRARKRHVSDEGRWLDQAAAAGLPVPPGAILLDEFYRFNLDTGLAQQDGRGVTVPDPELWHNTLFFSVRLPRFARPVEVRALAGATGAHHASCPAVDLNDAPRAAQAIASQWAALAAKAARHDILILETVAAEQRGSALCEAEAEADTICIDSPQGDAPVLALPRLSSRSRPAADQPPFARRLQQLLRGARRTLGPGDWRVEWVDDGRICWLTVVSALPRSAG